MKSGLTPILVGFLGVRFEVQGWGQGFLNYGLKYGFRIAPNGP